MNNISIIPALITASAAFIAAVLAQVISHWFTKKRDQIKTNKEIHQKFYFPILFDIYAYFDIQTAFRRSHDIKIGIDTNEIMQRIFRNIDSNLMFASPQIITAYHEVKRYEYHEDLTGYKEEISKLNLFWSVLDELYNLNKRSKLFDNSNVDIIVLYCNYFLIWILLSELQGENSYNVMSYKHELQTKK